MAAVRPTSRDSPREAVRAPAAKLDDWREMAPEFVRSVAALRLKALGHPDRLRAVEGLASGPMTVTDLAAAVRMPRPTVSRHLRVLADADVVRCSRRGNFVLYALADRDVSSLALVAYRGAGAQARRRLTILHRA